jgi:chromosome segregation ATPase
MAFYPQRFDDAFLAMLDRFHETYPEVGCNMMLHFEHPDEILDQGRRRQVHPTTQWASTVDPRDGRGDARADSSAAG